MMGKSVSVEDANSEVKYGTAAVELHNHEKSMGGAPIP